MTHHSTDVAAALEALRQQDGLLHIGDIVEAAADENSILHRHFTWDDTAAAKLYRLEEARALVRSQNIPFELGPAKIYSPKFVPAVDTVGAYRRLDEVQPGSADARDLIIVELGRMMGSIERVRRISVVIHMEDEVASVMASLAGLRAKVSDVPPNVDA